jgi:hypothetical protein
MTILTTAKINWRSRVLNQINEVLEMAWNNEEIIDGCLVRFWFCQYERFYYFKIFLDGDEIFNSNDQGGTEDKEFAIQWAATIIIHYLANLT